MKIRNLYTCRMEKCQDFCRMRIVHFLDYFVNARLPEELFNLFGSMKGEAQELYSPGDKSEFARIRTMVNSHTVWVELARFTANAFVTKVDPAYVYPVSYLSPSMQQMMRYGAAYASEIPCVFDTLRSHNRAAIAPKDGEVAKIMNGYWTNFAKNYDPNGNRLTKCPD